MLFFDGPLSLGDYRAGRLRFVRSLHPPLRQQNTRLICRLENGLADGE